MGGTPRPLSPLELYRQLGTATAPLVVDVRAAEDFAADDAMIVGAVRRVPETVDQWRHDLPAGRPAAVYCVHGREVGQTVAARLADAGVDAGYLDGGIAGWRALGLPTRRRLGNTPSGWVTRERPKIDRIACPWLVRRFIDPEATFLYVQAAEVPAVAARTGATPYDVADAEFGHVGDRCSFDAFLRLYGIADRALDRLALIVRGADTGRPGLSAESAGLLAVSRGLSENFRDDHAMLAQGMVVYDALYAWCRGEVAP
jgi:rhodanese-related sulfurtransferase